MDKTKESNILKSSIIIGGAQIVQMVVTILRAKLITIFLGSAGIGINALLQSVLMMINNISSCGIMQSSVREIAHSKTFKEQSAKINIFRKLVLIAGVLGFTVCLVGCYTLSILSFGTSSYTFTFILLGFGVLFFTLSSGSMTILQGTRNIGLLAKGSIFGSIFSLGICFPCYKYLGINGIVISIVLGYLLFWLAYKFSCGKLHIEKNNISIRNAITEGKPIIVLGAVLMVSTFLISFFTYMTNVSIRYMGSINDVGLYQGVASIATQSIVVVTSVLASDFFPRISELTNNVQNRNSLINQQLSIVIAITSSIVTVIICSSEFIIDILLSSEFIIVSQLLELMATSLFFRGIWITMSYIILAFGDRKRYLIYDAIIGNGINFLLNIVAYYIGGIQLLGYSVLLSSVIVCVVLGYIVIRNYKFKIERKVLIFITSLVMLISVTFITKQLSPIWSMLSCGVVIVSSMYILNSNFNFTKYLKQRFR